MSTFDYTVSQAQAERLITKYGADAVFTRITGRTADPVNGVYTGGTPTSITPKAVRFEYRKQEIDGALIQQGDFRLLTAPTAGEPLINDTVTFGGSDYRVMSVTPFSPAGVPVYYNVQVRA